MTTKLIAALVIVGLFFGAYRVFMYYEKVKNEKVEEEKASVAAQVVGNSLEGLPQSLESSLQAAQSQGVTGLRNWLKTYGHAVQDPRKAWIEIDYVVLLARESPAEARRLFAEIKGRTGPASPVWPRIKNLQSTFE